jgi:hypothetical protein
MKIRLEFDQYWTTECIYRWVFIPFQVWVGQWREGPLEIQIIILNLAASLTIRRRKV